MTQNDASGKAPRPQSNDLNEIIGQEVRAALKSGDLNDKVKRAIERGVAEALSDMLKKAGGSGAG